MSKHLEKRRRGVTTNELDRCAARRFMGTWITMRWRGH
jgi:hypothetical protein